MQHTGTDCNLFPKRYVLWVSLFREHALKHLSYTAEKGLNSSKMVTDTAHTVLLLVFISTQYFKNSRRMTAIINMLNWHQNIV